MEPIAKWIANALGGTAIPDTDLAWQQIAEVDANGKLAVERGDIWAYDLKVETDPLTGTIFVTNQAEP